MHKTISTRFAWYTPENKHGTYEDSMVISGKYTGFPCSAYRQIGRSSPSKNGGTILKSNLIGKPPTVFASLASLDNFTQIMIVLRVTNLN